MGRKIFSLFPPCSLFPDVGYDRDRINMPVASISIVEFRDRDPKLSILGDRSHLNQSLRNRLGT